jgi:hypothetical protein
MPGVPPPPLLPEVEDEVEDEVEVEEGENMSQKRMVSSAEAEQRVEPSGDLARCSTRDVCPRNSRI